MLKQNRGFMDGGAPVPIQITGVQVVEAAIGRLLILPPSVPPPPPDGQAKGAILVGTASAFRVVPQAPAAPGSFQIR